MPSTYSHNLDSTGSVTVFTGSDDTGMDTVLFFILTWVSMGVYLVIVNPTPHGESLDCVCIITIIIIIFTSTQSPRPIAEEGRPPMTMRWKDDVLLMWERTRLSSRIHWHGFIDGFYYTIPIDIPDIKLAYTTLEDLELIWNCVVQ